MAMRIFRVLSHHLFQVVAVCVLTVASCAAGNAQLVSPTSTGAVAGTVVDPLGAALPNAKVTATRAGATPVAAAVDGLGHYSVTGLPPGVYAIEAQAIGFRTARKEGVRVAAGAVQQVTFTLKIEVQQEQVQVSDTAVDSSPEKNGGALVLKGKDLDVLSDDPAEMQMQLQALAGGDSQFFVDGFSGGKLPPKSSIRAIMINQSPYSAQYDSPGWGRIEIYTKPGADKLHGMLWMDGNDSAMNSRNPFVTTQPPYYSYAYSGYLNGPIKKVASYFVDVDRRQAVNDSIVNAVVLDSSLNQAPFSQAIASPSGDTSVALRSDLQVNKVQSLMLRYQMDRSTATNGGIGQFSLPSQAIDSNSTEQVLRISDTQTYGAKVLNDTRFQYIRDRNNQSAQTQGPTIAVQGAFTGGGGNQGTSRDNQDHYEFQDYASISAGTHDVNFGGRLRAMRDSNYSTANFNGQYTFASLAAYQITEQGIKNGLTPAAIRAAGGGASMFSQTEGTPSIAVTLIDTGLYAEDNWKLVPGMTLSYGLRFETQTQIHDHADFGPRVALSWAVSGGKNKPPRAVIRTGYGFFYQRFSSGNLLQAQRQNGVMEHALTVNSPDFYPAVCTADSSACAGAQVSSPAIYRISPTLRSPYTMMGGIGVDKPLGKHGSMSANYTYSRVEHRFLTRNINAPLPGTFDPADPASGVHPLGTNENIFEYDSEGMSEKNQLQLNGGVHAKGLSLFGYYMLGKSNADTAGGFPSNQYDLHQDYGRASNDVRNTAYVYGYSQLPWGISLSPLVMFQSSSPFNIVVGQDLNGDTIFNDRPAFATDLSRASVYRTKWGVFDAQPIAGQTIIPINYGKGPGMVMANLRVNKSFSFGPALPSPPAPPAAAAAKDGKTESKTPAKPMKTPIQRKYNLTLNVAGDNILNHVNLAPPVGVLGSPLFGTSTALAGFGSGSANRTVTLSMNLQF